LDPVFARLVALLLLVVAMTSAATAAPDGPAGVVAMVDNTPDSLDLDPMATVRPVALPQPISQIVSPFAAALQLPIGRLHAVHVFRPPR
jgi:hypothetical protein